MGESQTTQRSCRPKGSVSRVRGLLLGTGSRPGPLISEGTALSRIQSKSSLGFFHPPPPQLNCASTRREIHGTSVVTAASLILTRWRCGGRPRESSEHDRSLDEAAGRTSKPGQYFRSWTQVSTSGPGPRSVLPVLDSGQYFRSWTQGSHDSN